MKNLNIPGLLLLCVLLAAVSLLQGCVPVAGSIIAYSSAVSAQTHAAYTEYLFAMQAKNKQLQSKGESLLPIIPEKQWRDDVYKPRLEYAHYYTQQISSNVPPRSFEDWKVIDYPLLLKERAAPLDRAHRK